MKDILLIYNPKAGDTTFRFSLDRFIELFSEKNWEIRVFRSNLAGDAEKYISECDLGLTEAIFVAGGTGTVNEVVNAMMRRDIRLPIGIIPAGTENEFARKLGFDSKDLETNLRALSKMDLISVDVGKAGDRYFVDSLDFGTLVSLTKISPDAKNTFGQLAYIVMGMTSVGRVKRIKLQIETKEKRYTGFFSYFCIANSNLLRSPRTCSGTYTLVASKGTSFNGGTRYFDPDFTETGITQKGALRLEGDYFKITQFDAEKDGKTIVQLDGDEGPSLPLEVRVYKHALSFFHNKENTHKKKRT